MHDAGLQGMLDALQRGRDVRNPKIVQKLNELGLPITYEDVIKEAAGTSVGRVHIARALITKKLVGSMDEIFKKYLAKGAAAYVNRSRFSAQDIINTIHKAGGVAFLAHPKQLNIPHARELAIAVRTLVDAGLDGIEVYNSSHTRADMKAFARLAKEFNILCSGGSDFHGTVKPYIDLGFVGNGAELSYETVEAIKSRARGKQR
jgi:predicted metal-dependent phosphoesterase TrpH